MLKSMWRFARWRCRATRTFLHAVSNTHPATQIAVGVILSLILFLTINWIYHAITKPTEVFFPLDRSLNKSVAETWQDYGPLFREHATAVITPELLAALAQVEGNGNPLARTYWQWQLSWNPLKWYGPASSAVGMFQMTNGTFHTAKRYCIHDHVVAEDGPWHAWHSCWFNSLYTRVIPSHAIEMTAALLDRRIATTVSEHRQATFKQKQELAAVINLCGARAGREFAARRFRLTPHQRCGSHDAKIYLTRVELMKQQFSKLNTVSE